MDVSFGVFNGRNGWGDQKSDLKKPFTRASQKKGGNVIEKIPVPVRINDLIEVLPAEEKFKIASYTINTVIL